MGGKWDTKRALTAAVTGGMSEVVSAVGPKTEKPPEMPNYEAQRAAADAEVTAAQLKDVNAKNSGLNSTILGGSAVADNSNLKKKKLLGE